MGDTTLSAGAIYAKAPGQEIQARAEEQRFRELSNAAQ